MWSVMLKTRIVTAIVLLAGLLAALFFLSPVAWVVFCALICACLGWEWGALAKWSGKAQVVYGITLGCLCLVLGLFLLQQMLQGVFFSLWLTAGLFWLLVVPFWLWRKWPLCRWNAALTGIIVLLPPMLIFIALRNFFSFRELLMACALVWVADIAAYFSGRTFGGKKLAPSISPGKTWAGAIGAVIGVLVYCNVMLLFAPGWLEMRHVLLLQPLFVSLAVWSIIGDLFESLLKRQAGVKDSSNLLPGHGGVLDRVDSLTSTLSLIGFYFCLKLLFFSIYFSNHP